MKRFLLIMMLMLGWAWTAQAAKTMYKPNTWTYNSSTQAYTENASTGLIWYKKYSKESTNCILFWQEGFGSDPTTGSITFDPDEVLQVAEQCYAMEVNTLGFNASNMVNTYKLMILMNYTNDWICYGGGYDFKCSALWLSPSTVKPAGSALAHEVGHSFHYMCYGQDSNFGANSSIQTGFHGAVGNGACIWETTANWQALASYPNEFFIESGMVDIFAKSHNYAFSHEWHRYQAYPFLYYLCEKYNDVKTVSQVWWKRETSVKDFNQVLMDTKNLSVEQLYRLHFDFAMHAVTWDLNPPSPYNVANYRQDSYIGKFNFNRVKLDAAKYQVAYASVPQSTGFNVIPLNIPSAGTTVTTKFTALAPGSALASGDPAQYLNGESNYASSGRTSYNNAVSASARGFRLGYVVLKSDGTRVYYDDDTRHCTGTGTVTENVSYTVPDGAEKMWLVVAPTPSTYIQHQWDENYANDDQWPYQVEFVNTDILGEATIDGRDISDVTITYDVQLQPDANGYSGTTININGSDLAMIGTAFQMSGVDAFNNAVAYSSNQSNGTIMNNVFVNGVAQNQGNTANGDFGHWFAADGTVTTWGINSVVFAEFNQSAPSVVIGQYPGANSAGDTRTICEALVYKDANGNTATAYLVFNITFSNNATNTATITNIEYTEPTANPIKDVTIYYDLTLAAGGSYEGATQTLGGTALSKLLEGFGMSRWSDVQAKWTSWNQSGPTNGQIMPYPVDADGVTLLNAGSTANGDWGYWYNKSGVSGGWNDNSSVYVEFDGGTPQFIYGQYPGHLSEGDTYDCRQALKYVNSAGEEAIAYFVFNVTIAASGTTPSLTINHVKDGRPDEKGVTEVPYTIEIHPQTIESESGMIFLTDADVTALGLTWEQARTYLTNTRATNNSVGEANHTLATNELMIYTANENGTANTALGVTRGDNGYWFTTTDYSAASGETDGAYAIAIDWTGSRWVLYQKFGTLTAGSTHKANLMAMYNDGTTTKKVLYKFTINVTPLPEVTLKDTDTSYEKVDGFCNVTLERSLPTGKWLTFSAPFNIGAGLWDSMGIDKVRKLTGVRNESGVVTLEFTEETDGIWIGIPVLIKMKENKTSIRREETGYEPYTAIHTTAAVESSDGAINANMTDTYVKIALPNDVYYISGDKFYHTNYTGTNTTAMKGFRAYFTITENIAGSIKSLSYSVDDEELDPTAIEGVEVLTNDPVDVYTLTGVKVKSGISRTNATEGMPKGVYIVDGKKMMVK